MAKKEPSSKSNSNTTESAPRAQDFTWDIDPGTEAKSREAQLQLIIEKMNLSLAAARMGMWEWNAAIRKLYWDERMHELHGVKFDPQRDIAMAVRLMVLPEDWPETERKTNHALESQRDFTQTYRILANGSIRHIRVFGRSMHDKEKKRMYGVAWDVTEEIENERQMAEARASMVASTKMAALGEMAGGIAHEINNPLTVIQARAFQLTQMIDSQNLDPHKIREAAESISATAERIAKIIRSLRSFTRDGAQDPFEVVSIHSIVENTLDFCKARFYNHGVDLQMDPIPENIEVECRTVQIEQVLLNLLNNSFDAIEELSDKWIRVSAKVDGDFVEIRVTDSGEGIAPHTAEKIMHPFFTTKEVGKGTGLGLSISTGIINNHQGKLFFDSQQTHTCFVVRLPRFQSP